MVDWLLHCLTPLDAMNRLAAYLAVARAPFLLLPVALVAAGAGAAAYGGAVDGLRTLAALVGLVGLHVAVDAWNEVSDYRRGIDLEHHGGERIETPPAGRSPPLPGELVSAVGGDESCAD